jgi:hypothetical protein
VNHRTPKTRDQLLAEATAVVLQRKLAALRPGAQTLQLPAPVVNSEVRVSPTPVHNEVNVPPAEVAVNVDMAPVAAAIDRLRESMEGRDELLAQLLRVLADMPAPVVNSEVRVSPTPVTVTAPNVTVEGAQVTVPPPANVRKATIRRPDGTVSVITIEDVK